MLQGRLPIFHREAKSEWEFTTGIFLKNILKPRAESTSVSTLPDLAEVVCAKEHCTLFRDNVLIRVWSFEPRKMSPVDFEYFNVWGQKETISFLIYHSNIVNGSLNNSEALGYLCPGAQRLSDKMTQDEQHLRALLKSHTEGAKNRTVYQEYNASMFSKVKVNVKLSPLWTEGRFFKRSKKPAFCPTEQKDKGTRGELRLNTRCYFFVLLFCQKAATQMFLFHPLPMYCYSSWHKKSLVTVLSFPFKIKCMPVT